MFRTASTDELNTGGGAADAHCTTATSKSPAAAHSKWDLGFESDIVSYLLATTPEPRQVLQPAK